LCDVEEALPLLSSQLANEFKRPLNTVDVSLFSVAFGAVDSVHPRVTQVDVDGLQWPTFPSRIQRDRHGRSSAESSQQQVVRRRTCIGAAERGRLVGTELVQSDVYGLRET
jgi:hypothetical protein